MISIKTSLASFISIFLAIGAYFLSSANLGPEVNNLLPSIFVVLTTVVFIVVTQLQSSHVASKTNESSQETNHSHSLVQESGDTGEISTLYIGNLAYKADEQAVKEYFEKISTVVSVRLVKDKRTGRRKGFGFIEIKPGDESIFIKKLNESEFMERNIIVRPANEKQH